MIYEIIVIIITFIVLSISYKVWDLYFSPASSSLYRLPMPTEYYHYIIGHLLLFWNAKFQTILETWADIYGPLYLLKFGHINCVVVSDFETVDYLLRNQVKLLKKADKLGDVLRGIDMEGILSVHGEKWKSYRSIIAPAFTASKIQRFQSYVIRESLGLKDGIEELFSHDINYEENSQSKELLKIIHKSTLALILKTGFGVNDTSLVKEDFYDLFSSFFLSVSERIKAIVPLWKLGLTNKDRKVQQTGRMIKSLLYQVLDNYAHSKGKESSDESIAFMELIFRPTEQDPNITDKDTIVRNMVHVMAAGYVTIASSLSWIIYYLALYPKYQKLIHDEADEMKERMEIENFNYSDASFTEAFVKEVLRLRSPLSIQVSANLEDLELLGVTLPKGTNILFLNRKASYNEDLFPNVYEFNPKRWLVDAGTLAKMAKGFNAFGNGPRICPGRSIAMMELITMIVFTLSEFDITFMDEAPGHETHEEKYEDENKLEALNFVFKKRTCI